MRFRTTLLLLALATSGMAGEDPAPGLRGRIDKGRDRLAEVLFGVQANAFADGLADYDDAGRRRTGFGSFELDLAKSFNDHWESAAALVASGDGIRLSVGFLDFHPFGGSIAPRGRLWVEKGFHLQAGRFDVPFGNDWQFFASKDSTSISRPLTTDRIMEGGYNDAGLRALGNNGTANFNLFLLRGFSAGRLLGGRLGLTPFSNPFSLKGGRDPKAAEFGLSWLYDTTSDGRRRQSAFAADAEGRIGSLYLRGEWIARDRAAGAAAPASHQRGWHLSPECVLGEVLPLPVTVFARYERVREDGPAPDAAPGDAVDRRVCLGFSTSPGGVLQVKAEVQRYPSATAATREAGLSRRTLFLLQLVLVL